MKLATYLAQLAAALLAAWLLVRHPLVVVAGSGAWVAAMGAGWCVKARWGR